MELDARHYARFSLDYDALQAWRRHACLPRTSAAQRSATYAAAAPLLADAAHALVKHHAWRPAASDDHLFAIHHPTTDALFALPRIFDMLFVHSAASIRMFDTVFNPAVYLNPQDGRLSVAPPLTDIFHLLQLLAPGCFTLVKAEYASHEVDDDGEVAWTRWNTFVHGLPPPSWMDFHAPQLIPAFGEAPWAALRRAAEDSEVLSTNDTTFN